MNYRNSVIAIILVICLVTMLLTILATADDRLSTSARSAAVYEPKTRSFPYSKNMHERLPMASTTKIMTSILAIEELDADEVISVPSDAVGIEGSSLYMLEGDEITVEDLVYALMLQSANDAATLLAIRMSGDVFGFANKMNAKAYEIGMSDTSFDNPHGLDSEEHFTTAHDLALLTAYALDNPTFREIVSTYRKTIYLGEKSRVLVNHNKLLRRYDGCIGVKTGYTDRSGRCLVSAAEREGISLIAVTLDAPDDWNDHTKMLDSSFGEYKVFNLDGVAPNEISIPVINGNKTSICARIAKEDGALVTGSGDTISTRLTVRQYLPAPIRAGDEVGRLEIFVNGEIYASYPYISLENCSKKAFTIFDFFKRG